ncbi:hypothetical protein EVAR_22391_1 [Eumeta japonica]|uniref:Uncharacterized protein n=1 Tax=Eumeta variegata TaxID=151549 RepID=A0A4C1VK18_EUMVA|nr:hypothetical protein EVAR_22391_1 [Eumeta japonica]
MSGLRMSIDDFCSWRGVVLRRAASCCDQMRPSPTPGDLSEDGDGDKIDTYNKISTGRYLYIIDIKKKLIWEQLIHIGLAWRTLIHECEDTSSSGLMPNILTQ